ncbi:hypothetical protein EYF80_060273 [Liparis tanakae]|uniref:Uncharacterized protein n=1 Tax=Liparis tanakae TaxID=230148 RepID=A0A4Z2ELG2_9TELE|nr:hypothetical protein EYF80_060273 [Liparis tanakae]
MDLFDAPLHALYISSTETPSPRKAVECDGGRNTHSGQQGDTSTTTGLEEEEEEEERRTRESSREVSVDRTALHAPPPRQRTGNTRFLVSKKLSHTRRGDFHRLPDFRRRLLREYLPESNFRSERKSSREAPGRLCVTPRRCLLARLGARVSGTR